jgi:hypothetical protein
VRLTINGEQVSYSLEHERTLGEVVDGLRSWLAVAGFHVTEIRADGRALVAEPAPGWASDPVQAVAELSVRATHTGDMRLEHWRTVDTWLAMLSAELAPGLALAGQRAGAGSGAEGGALAELLADLPSTIDGFKANPFLPPESDAARRFETLFAEEAGAGAKAWPAARIAEGQALIGELRASLAQRIQDAERPGEALARCATALRKSVDQLPAVSAHLQSGRDKAAMDIVVAFADAVQSLLGILPFLSPDPERGRLLAELTPVLREVVAAFGARDSVLIGDLLEYEVAPRLARLTPVLEKRA